MKSISLAAMAVALCFTCLSQNSGKAAWDSITAIENNPSLVASQKLEKLYAWEKQLETFDAAPDSVYSLILHKIGLYEFLVNRNYSSAIAYTRKSLRMSTSGGKKCSRIMVLDSYFNLAYYYDKLTLFHNALTYYDSVISAAGKFPGKGDFILDARLNKAYIFFRIGDYQKSVEESTIGFLYATATKDSTFYAKFLNQKAQSLFFQNQLKQSLADVNAALGFASAMNQSYQLASAYKMKGYIYARTRAFPEAEAFFKKSIATRLQTNDYGQIAGDYNDLGNMYRDSLNDLKSAEESYLKGILYAQRDHDSVRLCRLQVNLSESNIRRGQYDVAARRCIQAFQYLKIDVNSILWNPSAARLNSIGNKELILALMLKKTELLLLVFKKGDEKKNLDACLQTALLTDSVLTQIRHEQLGEQSKLYWRTKTREFFSNALEACYFAGKPELAFYFMEKSRAVLLIDRLNELGAYGELPPAEVANEQQLRINIIEQQSKIDRLNDSTAEYKRQQIKLLTAKEDFERYIKTIEKKYPAYYQYKYADKVNTLTELREYLGRNQQSFVHYFMGDTLSFILSATSAGAKIYKLSNEDLRYGEISDFLLLCSDKQRLNNNYALFASLSNRLYKVLFQPLQLQNGRVIICLDNFLIPFEALCTDPAGNYFLLFSHSFSYVYSARYLLRKFDRHSAAGNFIGFAPVSYNPSLNVRDLNQSAVSLRQSAAFYKKPVLLTNSNATKYNFIHLIRNYTIVNIFSHATADTSDIEPRIFMQDSMVYLSELQLLNKPAIQLVMLNACQTNVGKNATGEGIYSLARGFAAAGIPSVTATMWNAEELSMQKISAKFHENLSKGMRKDDALQNAKIFFIQNNNRENSLPFYWANMILIGNSESIVLPTNAVLWWWAGGIGIVLFILLLLGLRRKVTFG